MKSGEGKLRSLFLKINFLLLISYQITSATLFADADWTFLVYVQANNNLNSFAEKNFADMATIGSTANLNVLVEWHQPNHPGVWRYKIDKRKMIFDSYSQPESDGNSVQDLVQAMQWAKSKYPANKYAFILWNHAIGIIDPKWGKYPPRNQPVLVNPSTVKNNPRIQIDGLTINKTDASFLPATEISDFQLSQETRGILFNESSKTYVTNQILTTALAEIKNNVLGKKLDLLGMDACLMAMVEVGYQARNYADFLVASEEVELAHGWAYSPILDLLKNNKLTPAQLAQAIVLTYDNYYHNKVHFYTQSAIELKNMDYVKDAIDNVIIALNNCQKLSNNSLKNLIKKARSTCLQFSAPNYVDLNSFLSELLKQVDSITIKTTPNTNCIEKLKEEITLCRKIVSSAIIASAAGRNMHRASGLSIYYPTLRIDDSYVITEFAKESLWLSFLQNTITS